MNKSRKALTKRWRLSSASFQLISSPWPRTSANTPLQNNVLEKWSRDKQKIKPPLSLRCRRKVLFRSLFGAQYFYTYKGMFNLNNLTKISLFYTIDCAKYKFTPVVDIILQLGVLTFDGNRVCLGSYWAAGRVARRLRKERGNGRAIFTRKDKRTSTLEALCSR